MHRHFAFIFVHIVLLNIGVFLNADAQQRDTTRKQMEFTMDSIIVKDSQKFAASNRKFSPGTNLIKVSQEALAKMQMCSLAEFFQQENAAYIKEYGRGMGAFLSVRGTSSSHTTIAWNGQNLAVPTMGQTDFSHIPLYFFDEMEIHIGGSSALYGDGSIGGSIQLTTKAKWDKGFHGDVILSAGSFKSFFEGVTLRYSGKTTESRTSILQSSALNNYPFINNTTIGMPKEYLNNSANNNYGILQEVYKKFRNTGNLSATLLYLDFHRQIQPSVSSNNIPDSYGSISDRNLKVDMKYNIAKEHFSYAAGISYAYDIQKYQQDIIATNRLTGTLDGEYRLNKLIIKVGASAEYIKPDVYSYADSIRENRLNLYALLRYVPYPNLFLSAGLRYAHITNADVPLMPSLDAKYLILSSYNHTLSLRASVSQNSKVPTLNDRYWGGEHLYLKSEKSLTVEGGSNYSWVSDDWSVDIFGTIYQSAVKDWIRWLPAGVVWRPQNIPEVLSQGAEAGAHVKWKISELALSLDLSYAHTNIKMIKALWAEDPAVGEQLAYQPRHSWRTKLMVANGTISLYGVLSYTGVRTTIDLYDILPSYLLADFGATFSFKLYGLKLTANGVIKNIFDVSYQNVKFYAMPGRNCQISLQWKF